MSDVNELLIVPLQKFSKDSMHLIKKCTKPDRKGESFIVVRTSFFVSPDPVLSCTAIWPCGLRMLIATRYIYVDVRSIKPMSPSLYSVALANGRIVGLIWWISDRIDAMAPS